MYLYFDVRQTESREDLGLRGPHSGFVSASHDHEPIK